MADGRLAAVILAAGRSVRLGRPKALIPIDGQPVLERLLDVYLEAGIDPVVVVVSPETKHAVGPNAIAVDGDPSAQMIDSVIRGLGALPADVRGAIVQPVDAPFTSTAMLERLAAGAADRVRALVHEGRPGHPVYVPRRSFDAVRARPAGGLREVILDQMESIEWHSPEILADLDTEEDLKRWLAV